MRPRLPAAALAAALAAVLAAGARGLEFEMLFQTKCLLEAAEPNQLVVANWRAVPKSPEEGGLAFKTIKVEAPSGEIVYEKSNQLSGDFVFTAKEAGDYKACFTAMSLDAAKKTKISIDWKIGVAATDWEAIAKKDNLDRLGTELKKLESVVKEIHEEMLYMRKREEEMRDLNEATNGRVAWFSILSLGVCIFMAVFQVAYLKKFFKRKKVL